MQPYYKGLIAQRVMKLQNNLTPGRSKMRHLVVCFPIRLKLVSEIRCSNRTDSKTKTTLRHDIKVEELPDNQKSLCRFILNLLFPSISIIIY